MAEKFTCNFNFSTAISSCSSTAAITGFRNIRLTGRRELASKRGSHHRRGSVSAEKTKRNERSGFRPGKEFCAESDFERTFGWKHVHGQATFPERSCQLNGRESGGFDYAARDRDFQ